MKKFVSIIAGLVVGSALAVIAQPANFSGNDLNPATKTQSDIADAVANTAILQDQSKIPDQDNRVGYLSFLFDVSKQGGSGTIDVGPIVPKGVAVVGGRAHVVTAFNPAASATNTTIGLVAAADLKAASSSLGSTGLIALKPSTATVTVSATGTATSVSFSAPVVTTADSQIELVFGSAATQGVVLVHLDLLKVQ